MRRCRCCSPAIHTGSRCSRTRTRCPTGRRSRRRRRKSRRPRKIYRQQASQGTPRLCAIADRGTGGWGGTAKPEERSRGRSSRIRTVASNARDNLRYIGADTIEIFVLPGTKFVDAGCCAGRVARWHGGLGMDCRCEEKQQGEHCEEWGRGHSVC